MNADDKSREWKQCFIDYINPQDLYAKTSGSSEQAGYSDKKAYKLWDMDKDGVPEVICSFFENSASSSVLLAFNPWNSTIMESGLERVLTYNEKELCGSNSFGGVSHSIVYTKNADGSLKEEFSYGWSSIEGMVYYLDEQEISETEYQQIEDKYSQPLELDMTYTELIQAIKNYT